MNTQRVNSKGQPSKRKHSEINSVVAAQTAARAAARK